MVQRQLIWNVISHDDGDPPRQEYTFLLVNEPRELDMQEQRIKEELAPTDQEHTITEGLISGSGGLHYKVIQLNSYKRMTPEDFDPRKIHDARGKGAVRRDEKLGHHRTKDGLSKYVDAMFAR